VVANSVIVDAAVKQVKQAKLIYVAVKKVAVVRVKIFVHVVANSVNVDVDVHHLDVNVKQIVVVRVKIFVHVVANSVNVDVDVH
jgi:hypothetical protein